MQAGQQDGKGLQPGLAQGSSALSRPLCVCDSSHTTEPLISKLAYSCICRDTMIHDLQLLDQFH